MLAIVRVNGLRQLFVSTTFFKVAQKEKTQNYY